MDSRQECAVELVNVKAAMTAADGAMFSLLALVEAVKCWPKRFTHIKNFIKSRVNLSQNLHSPCYCSDAWKQHGLVHCCSFHSNASEK